MGRISVSREQLWLLHDLLGLELASAHGVLADTVPVRRPCAERLLEALCRAEEESRGVVDIELDTEDAFRLAVALKSTYRDATGMGVRPLILACIRVGLGLDRKDEPGDDPGPVPGEGLSDEDLKKLFGG